MVQLAPELLCRICDAARFSFQSTDQLEDLTSVIGQPRAVEAIRFGLGVSAPGHNIFALGPPGLGKHRILRSFIDAEAAKTDAPYDWCYVHNFKESHKPSTIGLPPGKGSEFRAAMDRLIEDLKGALAAAFTGEEYRTRRKAIEEEIKERQEDAIEAVEKASGEKDIALIKTPMGYGFAPMVNGRVVTPEVFERMAEADRERAAAHIKELEAALRDALQKFPVWLQETREQLRRLNEETATFAVSHLIGALRERFAGVAAVVSYLDEVARDIIANVDAIMHTFDQGGGSGESDGGQGPMDGFRRYRVNLLVDHGDAKHAPIVYEDEPTFERLLGRIEHRAQMGALVTDFNLIRAGSLHRANGGYLIVDARKLLTQPMAWEGLKRVLRAGRIRIEPLSSAIGLPSTTTLEPETIPCEVKIVLIGERLLYYLLSAYDPDFPELFKVAADFDDRLDRSDETDLLFARMIGAIARRKGMMGFDATAVSRLIEYSSRLAESNAKLSADVEALADLMRESEFIAKNDKRATVSGADVLKARDAQTRRADRVAERMLEEMKEGTILIDTEGAAVGQINGLSVIQIGRHAFGRPSRITARIRLGKGSVVDIEREVKLGGPLHSKGVLILSSYLGATFASDRPLSLSASLVFEQSYGGVDGDSASSAELYALLSALSGVPIKQCFAVTGSVNQNGQVQAIGGVNEKIEGFFDLCAARGLDGAQGVLIPKSNVKHLMLHQRVVDAARKNLFQIHAVGAIAEGIEILTGRAAGQRGKDGAFPEGSINRLVEDRLIELAEAQRRFSKAEQSENA